jgi:glycosyltransferase involved in cell wall biosynthesis
MKIAVVTRYFPSSAEPSQGRSAYQTLRVLAREADVHVFYPNAAYPAILRPHGRTYKTLDRTYCPPDVKTSYYDFPALPLVTRPVNGWLAARVLLPHVRAFAPDVIFSCFLYPDGYAALKIGKALGVPVVAMSIGSDINRIGDPLSAAFTKTVLRESDALVTVSGDLHRKAVSMGAPAASSRAILNGCDLSVFHPRDRAEARQKLQLDADKEAIVYIGRTDVRKGLRELVESVAALHRARPKVHAYLIGWGPDKAILEGDIRRHNAAGFVHLLPNCAFDDVAVWMAAADLITLPSYMEGCPNVILEALASGRPVVATNVGGIPELMSDACGRLVPPRDAASLTKALDEVLDASWDAEAISASWSRSWSASAGELMQVFESLVKR